MDFQAKLRGKVLTTKDNRSRKLSLKDLLDTNVLGEPVRRSEAVRQKQVQFLAQAALQPTTAGQVYLPPGENQFARQSPEEDGLASLAKAMGARDLLRVDKNAIWSCTTPTTLPIAVTKRIFRQPIMGGFSRTFPSS
jgi:hypothetical protein